MEQIFYLPSSMLWPLAACLVLTGIHVYLGVHVIARKVIFVDLALAQIAALGTVTGVLLGFEVGKDLTALYLYSLAFTIFGAFIFAATRMRSEKVPHEAIIGIVYAVTFAATILVLSRSPLGPQELDHIIKGELLWVQGPTVIKTAVIYALVGLFHFIFRRKFMAISINPVEAEKSGINVRLWDFLFYMSFGFVITSSVSIAGVFLVFSYLVIPSVGAMLVSDRLGMRLALGWIGAAFISFMGVKLSWSTGLPTSPLIVVLFAAALLGTGAFRLLRNATSKTIALRNLAAALAVVALFIAGLYLFRKREEDPLEHALHMLTGPLGTDRQVALSNLASYADRKNDWLPLVFGALRDRDAEVRKAAVGLLATLRDTAAADSLLPLLGDGSEEVQMSAVKALRTLGSPAAGKRLLERSAALDDPELKSTMLQAALEMGNADAIPPLIQMVTDGGLFADDAFEILKGHVDLPFHRDDPQKMKQWWDDNKTKLRWDEKKKMFFTAS